MSVSSFHPLSRSLYPTRPHAQWRSPLTIPPVISSVLASSFSHISRQLEKRGSIVKWERQTIHSLPCHQPSWCPTDGEDEVDREEGLETEEEEEEAGRKEAIRTPSSTWSYLVCRLRFIGDVSSKRLSYIHSELSVIITKKIFSPLRTVRKWVNHTGFSTACDNGSYIYSWCSMPHHKNTVFKVSIPMTRLHLSHPSESSPLHKGPSPPPSLI